MEAVLQKVPVKTRTHGSLFAGIGGLCSAFNTNGFVGAFANEIEPAVAQAYRSNHHVERFFPGTIEDIRASNLPSVDVLHGGFPCQPFSVAGTREGFSDRRGMLFMEIPRLLREFGERRPKVVLLENSPNLLLGEGGAWIRKIVHELNKAGYWFDVSNAIVLDVAKHGGLPQKRERLFIIALDSNHFGGNFITQKDFPVSKPCEMRELIDPAEEVDDSYYLPVGNRYEKQILEHRVSDPYQIYQLRKFYVRVAPPGLCPTLTAHMGLGGHNVPFIITNGRVRKLTETECLRLQGFDERFKFPDGMGMGARYQMIGNAVSPKVANLLVGKINQILDGLNE
jgi:DNA (cytosine-5)-methyltransferase 1